MREENKPLIVLGVIIVMTVIFVSFHTRLDQLNPMALTWELSSHAVLDIVNG